MADSVRLKHVTRRNDWLFYHYSGFERVTGGVIELPADNFTLLKRAYGLGFTLTEDGQPINFAKIVAVATGKDSLEEQASGKRSNRGRQPSTTDRVRESESDSSGNADNSRSRSGVPSGSGKQESESSADSGN